MLLFFFGAPETAAFSGDLEAGAAQMAFDSTLLIGADGDLQAAAAQLDGELDPLTVLSGDLAAADAVLEGLSSIGQDLARVLDENVFNDADYVKSPVAPSGEAFRVSLTNPVEAIVPDSPVIVRYRIGKTNAGGRIDFTVRLFEVDDLIAEWGHDDVPAGFTTLARTLSSGEVAAITNFDDLALEFAAEAA